MEWGYNNNACPPEKWHEKFAIANGTSQSPIDIQTGKIEFNNTLGSIQLDYKNDNASDIVATGASVQVNFNPGSTIKGAHLKGTYSLAQFHLHWGKKTGSGSEHTIDGKAAEAEIHFVHWNSTKYSDIGEALKHEDGLAVLGALIKQDDAKSNNNQAQQIIKHFPAEWKVGEKNLIEDTTDFEAVLPSTANFFCYSGSLTTPPLLECVKWIVLRDPIYFSEAEMNAFRNLPGNDGPCLCNNYRPPQPLHDRKVQTNFDLI